jgi:hypothetical protein
MTHDEKTRLRSATFRSAGVGMSITQNCDFCGKPRHQLGGRVVKRGPLRLFKCALCREADEAQQSKEP